DLHALALSRRDGPRVSLIGDASAVDCATLRFLRFRRTTTHPKTGAVSGHWTTKRRSPSAVQRSASLPRAVRQPDHGDGLAGQLSRGGSTPLSRNATLRSFSVQARVSSSTDWSRAHSTR